MEDYDKEIKRLEDEIEKLNKLQEQRQKLSKLKIEQEPTLKEKADFSYNVLQGFKEKELKKIVKKLKLPRKAKVRKGRLKKSWIGVLYLAENKVIRGERTKLEGGTYVLKDGNTRYTNDSEIVWWEGKYPIIFQRHDKANPSNPYGESPKVNEVYGQDQIKLRMKKDVIKEKGRGGMSWLIIVAILVGGYFLLKAFFPSLFGG